MNEKDLEKAREEAYERETQKMMKAIRANHEEAYNKRLLQEQINKIQKEKLIKREAMVNIIQVVTLFLLLFALIVIMLYCLGNCL